MWFQNFTRSMPSVSWWQTTEATPDLGPRPGMYPIIAGVPVVDVLMGVLGGRQVLRQKPRKLCARRPTWELDWKKYYPAHSRSWRSSMQALQALECTFRCVQWNLSFLRNQKSDRAAGHQRDVNFSRLSRRIVVVLRANIDMWKWSQVRVAPVDPVINYYINIPLMFYPPNLLSVPPKG